MPTAITSLTSPLESDELRKCVREVWSSKDPAQKLLDSLLIDYMTEKFDDGKLLQGWYEESDGQIAAAVRLLYYFPKEMGPLISARLRSLDVGKAGAGGAREEKNGVQTIDFIKAVSFSRAPGIQEALAGILKRTDDKTIREALSSAK